MTFALNPAPLFGLGNVGKSPNVDAQTRVNLYVEIQKDGEKGNLTMYPTPGLVGFVNFGANPCRGMYQKGDYLYAVNGSTLWQVANDGTQVSLGTLLTSGGKVDITDNGFQMLIVDGTYGYIYVFDAQPAPIASITRISTLATLTTTEVHKLGTGMQVTISGATPAEYNGTYTVTVTSPTTFNYTMASDPGASAAPVGSYVVAGAFGQITSPDFPPSRTCAFLNGRFLVGVTNSAQFFISALYDGLSWDALDFATAESDPDNLVRVYVDSGQVVLFGDKTTEFWGDSGALDFPFARVGASAIEWGLAAVWSVAKFQDALMFLRKNRLGAVQVCTLSGYSCVVVSNPEMDYVFSQYAAVSDAVAFSYMVSGHPFYQINFPSANASWIYDGLTNAWSRVQSGTSRHRAELQRNFLDRSYVSDYENGQIYRFDVNAYTDNGSMIIREWTSRHQMSADWSGFDELWIEMQTGVGDQLGQGRDPQLMMQVSKDGGNTWGSEVWVPIGKIGEYMRRAVYRRLGRARDWAFKFRVTDPVYAVFIAAWARYGRTL